MLFEGGLQLLQKQLFEMRLAIMGKRVAEDAKVFKILGFSMRQNVFIYLTNNMSRKL